MGKQLKIQFTKFLSIQSKKDFVQKPKKAQCCHLHSLEKYFEKISS